MKISQVIFIILLALFFLENLWTSNGEEDDCRSVIYKSKIPGKSLTGHVIARESVQTLDQCHILCFIEPNCVSINYNTKPGVKENCELSSSSDDKHPKSLKARRGFIYETMKNNCIGKVCSPSNKTCQSGYGPHGYRCICPDCTHGKNCEKYNKDAVLFFQKKSISNTVILENSFRHLTKFTIGMWVQVDQGSTEHTLFSYATKSNSNELYLVLKNTNIEISVKGNDTSIPMNSSIDENWHHICLAWETTAGLLIFYKDGSRLASRRLSAGVAIERGVLVLGQEQDSYKGGFQKVQSFQGNMTKFNIWNRVLSDDELSDLVKKSPSGEGNVVKWTKLIAHRSQSIKPFCGKSCHPV